MDFAVPAEHRVYLKESEKKDKYGGLVKVLKTMSYMKVTTIPIVIGALVTVTKGLVTGGFGNKRTSGDHSNYTIVGISQTTEKNPVDLKGLVVTQDPVSIIG